MKAVENKVEFWNCQINWKRFNRANWNLFEIKENIFFITFH